MQTHFMLKLVSSILMGMRPFAKPLRWRSSSSSVTSKNLICTSERELSTACEQSDGTRQASKPLLAQHMPPVFQHFQGHTSAVANYVIPSLISGVQQMSSSHSALPASCEQNQRLCAPCRHLRRAWPRLLPGQGCSPVRACFAHVWLGGTHAHKCSHAAGLETRQPRGC